MKTVLARLAIGVIVLASLGGLASFDRWSHHGADSTSPPSTSWDPSQHDVTPATTDSGWSASQIATLRADMAEVNRTSNKGWSPATQDCIADAMMAHASFAWWDSQDPNDPAIRAFSRDLGARCRLVAP